jgi:hypothetical protein
MILYNELERIRKEVVVTYFEINPELRLKGMRKTTEILDMISVITFKIQTRYFPNKK